MYSQRSEIQMFQKINANLNSLIDNKFDFRDVTKKTFFH